MSNMLKHLDPTEWIFNHDKTQLIHLESGTCIERKVVSSTESVFIFYKYDATMYCQIWKESMNRSLGMKDCVCFEYWEYLERIFTKGFDYSDCVF